MSDRPELLPAYIIAGSDAPKVQRTVRRLKHRIIEESGSDLNLAVLDAIEYERGRRDASELVNAVATPGLVLGHRAVVVLNAHKLKAPAKGELASLVGDLPPETTVAFVGTSFPKSDKLRKAVAAVGSVLVYDLPHRREYPAWLGERAGSMGMRLAPKEARRLAARVGDDAWRLETELVKLAAYVGAEGPGRPPVEVTGDDIDTVCSPALDVQVWDLTDAVGRRDLAAAFSALEELLAGGDQRRGRDGTRGLLGLLWRHLAYLRRVRLLERPTAEQVAAELDIHPYRARKLVEQAESVDLRLLDRALAALAAADAGMVGGSQLPPELTLERALAEVVRG